MADDDDYIDYDDYVFEEKKRRSSLNNFARRQCRNLAHFLVEDWCLSAVLGISMAFCSVGMDYWIEHLQQWHVTLYKYAQDISDHAAFGAWTGYVLVLVLASTIFVHYVAPQAIGSGIPEVKTIMRGVMLKEYVTFRTLISKMVGLTLSLGSGLPIGKEGPFIHVAATVGTLISKLTSSCNKGVYANESRYSEMLATACAVGVSCTFSAPVGGVLFSIEVTAVHFAVRNYWRAFFAAACSAIVFRLLRIFLQQTDTAVVAFYQTNFPQESFFPEELPIFALLGIICGFLGAFYIIVHRKISLFVKNNDLFKKIFKANLLVYPVAVTMLVTSLTYPSGYGKLIAGHLKFRDVLQDFFGSCSWHKTPGSDSDSLTCKRDLLDHWTGGANGDISIFITLLCFIVTFFLLSLICTTLPVPCGIFMPVFVIGAATGRLLGESVAILFPEGIRGIEDTQIYPGVYAIVGAAALSGACTHTVSVAVIVFELTGQITYMLPVLIAILFSNAICTYLQPSIYDSTIKMKRLPYLPAIPPSRSSVHVVKAEQIMVVNVKYITKLTTYRELRDLLAEVPNLRSFPVVTDSGS
uniref:Chloride channel protein n=1 Tax=Plectus sambesii TaxID=2011161 RepID=A0A914WW06_9BILA